MIGMLHFGILEACSATQIQFITSELLKQPAAANSTATDLFATDLIYYPMFTGLTTLVFGVICGAVFAYFYNRLLGSNSKKKAMVLVIPEYIVLNFMVGFTFGPAFFLYQCSPNYLPIVPSILGVGASFVFGYILGIFFDSFGRLKQEQDAEEKTRRQMR